MATYRTTPAYEGGGFGARLAVARVITAAAAVVALIIAAAIALQLLNANASNDLVNAVHDAGSWLSSPFHGLFSIHDADWKMVVNWGLAAVVYLIAARLIARMIAR
jgi:hypothetical protein